MKLRNKAYAGLSRNTDIGAKSQLVLMGTCLWIFGLSIITAILSVVGYDEIVKYFAFVTIVGAIPGMLLAIVKILKPLPFALAALFLEFAVEFEQALNKVRRERNS